MSYSFTTRAATKADAKDSIDAELGKVVASQSIHARDRTQAQAAAEAFIDLLADDDTKDIAITMHGSVSWAGSLAAGGESDATLLAAGVAVSAMLVDRPAA